MIFFNHIATTLRRHILLLPLLCLGLTLAAQRPMANKVELRQGKIVISLSTGTSAEELDAFAAHYGLEDLPLAAWLQNKALDTLRLQGWTQVKKYPGWFVIERPGGMPGRMDQPEQKISTTGKHEPNDAWMPTTPQRQHFAFNKFAKSYAYQQSGQQVTLEVRGYREARQLLLAGTFTQWQQGALPMTRTAEGWRIALQLEPGKHHYKLIADGKWVYHAENELRENDGMGNMNNVLAVTNHTFALSGYSNARQVYVAGSFTGWQWGRVPLQKTNGGWQLPVYLPEGTHTYRYMVGNQWKDDPANTDRLPNEYDGYNSVVRIGKPYVFRLEGFAQARSVRLVGSFNQWQNHELLLQPRQGGWEILYTPGTGNHTYQYEVDGKRVGPPASVQQPAAEVYSLVIGANHRFVLPGHTTARRVMVSGNFNQWSTDALPMHQEGGQWVADVYLPPGKTIYKFIVDGSWLTDPANAHWENNGQGTRNSVLWKK